MRLSFEHDLAHNYVIPEAEVPNGEAAFPETEYELHMLEENQIPGFLDCVRKKINGKNQYYYEITSRQSLTQICESEPLTAESIRLLLYCLYQALQQMDPYLLDGNKIVLEPEMIYLDIESREAFFCYWPLCGKTIQESFRMLASYLLYHLERSDTEAVLLMYEINRKVQEKNFALLDLLQEKMQAAEQNRKPENQYREKDISERNSQENIQEENILQEKTEKSLKNKDAKKKREPKKKREMAIKQKEVKCDGNMAAGVICLVVLGIVAIAARMEFLTITQAGGIAFLLIGGMAYVLSPEKRRKKKKEKEKKKSEINWEMPEPVSTVRENGLQGNQSSPPQEEMVGATTVLWEGGEKYQQHLTLISMNARERNSVVLVNDSYLIGKLKSKVDIYIDDASVSRIHARIQKEENEYYLCDMNSTNGTYLNGRRLGIQEKVPIHVSDEITFAGLGYYVGNC